MSTLVVAIGRERSSLKETIDRGGCIVAVRNGCDGGVRRWSVALRSTGKDPGITGRQRKRIDLDSSLRGSLEAQRIFAERFGARREIDRVVLLSDRVETEGAGVAADESLAMRGNSHAFKDVQVGIDDVGGQDALVER